MDAKQSSSALPSVAECDERIAEAQYVIDHAEDYHMEANVQAHKDRARWQFNRRFAQRIAELESAAEGLLAKIESMDNPWYLDDEVLQLREALKYNQETKEDA